MRRGHRLISLTLLAVGCAADATGPGTPQALTGNYAGFFKGQVEVLTIHLEATAGTLTGFGWSTITAGMLGGAGIIGTYSGDSLEFDLLPSQGLGPWHFSGRLRSDTLTGDFAIVPGAGFQVALERIDTVPTGTAFLDLSGALSLAVDGEALFAYEESGSKIVLAVKSQGETYYWARVVWLRSSPPPPGTYSLATPVAGIPTATFVRYAPSTDPMGLTITAGAVVIQASNRFALIGHFEFSVLDPVTNASSLIQGTFSAGCIPQFASPC